jgi:hypothetical protein
MNKLTKKACAVALAAVFTLSSSVAPVFAADSALMKSPAKDAAYVIDLAGIQNAQGKNLTDISIAHNEGIVIRQSRIENGKIIIPKSGLYYTSRSGRAEILTGWKVFLLGKEYTVVDTKDTLEVIKDANLEKGGKSPIGKSKALELSSTSTNGNGFEAAGATFQILKPSGNYYGTDFPVNPDHKLKDITTGVLNKGTARAAGSYLPGQFDFSEYYGTHVAVSGQSYLVVDKATAKGAHVVEFGTGNMYEVLLSDKAPVEMLLGKGEKGNLGDYTVNVTDITANTASVELTGKDGKVTKKVFGPLTEDLMEYLPADEIARQKLIVRSEKEDVALQLDAFRKPFRDGKVALVGYTDLFKVTEGGQWAKDSKFIARPDT